MEQITTPDCGAMIQFSRISGQKVLYGSPFYHQKFIRLRISKAQTYRSFHDNEYMAENIGHRYIEVDLSFSQFAECITSMNIGNGVPCTLYNLMGKEFEQPTIDDNRIKLDDEIKNETTLAIESITELINLIETEKLTAKVKSRLLNQCHKIVRVLNDHLPFIAQMYAEHLDKLEQQAKTEIAAYCDLAVMQVGLDTLQLPQLPESTSHSRLIDD